MGVPKCPRSEIAYGTKNTSYIWNTVESCKSACEDSDTCNMVSRYGGWVGRNGHCYVYSCPDPSNITWVKQTSWGHGADSASTYKLMDRLVTPLVNPPVPPVDPWVHDTSHNGQVPKCPRSEIAYGTKNTSYIYNTVESCKSACEDSDTCNMVSRYGGWVGRNGHCYVYSCPDPSNITWVKQTSWGHGADSASTYKLMDRLVTPLVKPPVPPVDPWVHDTSNDGQVPNCPRSEIAYGTKNTSYIWSTVESCKSA